MNISRRVFLSGITALVVLGVIGSLGYFLPAAAQGTGPQVKVDSQVLDLLQGGKSADFVIVMAEQADLSAAYGITDWDERGWYVYNTLRETAARSQQRTIEQLKRHGVRYESFFAGNEIYVHGGSLQALNAVLDLGDVGHVRAPVTVQLDPVKVEEIQSTITAQPQSELQAELQSSITWGLNDTGAPNFWNAYGRQGQGIIVANIDSGVQYNHPALAAAYRCASGSLPTTACWYDATNPTITIPYDDNGHGTHTMGTMVGSNNPQLTYTVGMAPGAQWIACKAFASNGYASDSALIACAQWILAPGGQASNRPHIVNNSWGGDNQSTWYESWVNAWAAAGIFPVFSAGNKGSPTTCSNIYSPGDYINSFTVAAHDSSRIIASFSSKGPNYVGSVPYLKPNISAPGVNIYSSYPPTVSWPYYWAAMDGTSMAAPHVSGAVALLWSCNPALIGNIGLTDILLQNSAGIPPEGSCGKPSNGDGNYTYGHGYLNVYAAGITACGDWFATYLPLITNNYDPNLPPGPIQNGGFESGRVAWTEYSKNYYYIVTNPSEEPDVQIHNGFWAAWLGGANDEIAYIYQTIFIPVGRPILHYWYYRQSSEVTCGNDIFTLKVNEGTYYSEAVCKELATGQWVKRTADLSSYAGTTATIEFYMSTDASAISSVFLDDISLETSASLSSTGSSAAGVSVDAGLSKVNPQP